MADIWFWSDPHLFHENIIKYCNRPFANAERMNEALVESWNMYCKPQDKGYWLGDIAMGFGGEEDKLSWLLHRFNGKLRMNPGNHDNLKSPALHRRFEKIEYWSGAKEWPFFTHHVPLHQGSFRGKNVVAQAHGHTHNNFVEGPYINTCVDVTNFKPMHLDDIIKEANKFK